MSMFYWQVFEKLLFIYCLTIYYLMARTYSVGVLGRNGYYSTVK
jgi:hypothetical protein